MSSTSSLSVEWVIRGWQLGIPMLHIGGSATFYIPSGLAYGPKVNLSQFHRIDLNFNILNYSALAGNLIKRQDL